ncbi:MAG: sterol desaturase family protein [Methylohalobius sp. ZOD2]|nr:sterol desaturase family protein [Methylothermaceae bacterium]
MPDWNDWILSHEMIIRLGCTLGVLAIMAGWERVTPRRRLILSKTVRWLNNLVLVALNSLLVRLLFPAAAVGVAAFAAEHGWGLLHHYRPPFVWAVIGSVMALDLVVYLQHVMMHAVPAFWRLHRVHHADVDFDVTTGLRFHPLEILLSLLIKFAAIVVLGVPVVAVVIFEVLLNATALFNHSNIRLPLGLDRVLRWLVVTPDMHRVHHSVEEDETNSNFGFNLPWWDRLLGTYRAQPRAGHEGMTIGLHGYHRPKQVAWLPGLLAFPFAEPVDGYVINRRVWSPPRQKR